MKTNFHPIDPKAIYREIANDREPGAFARPGEMAARDEAEAVSDDTLEDVLLMALGAAALFAGVFALWAIRRAFA